MNKKSFISKTVFYCSDCHGYKISEIDCDHEFQLVLFRLSNGMEQLRNVCKKCYCRQSKALKQANYDMMIVPVKDECSYQDFYSKLISSESEDLRTFLIPFRRELSSDFYKTYTDYISSSEWKKLREKILIRDSGVCRICGSKAEQVHHLTYAHLKSEFDFELVSLCYLCHKNEYHKNDI